MDRDYTLAQRLSALPDDTLVDVVEVAALTGFKPNSIRSHRVNGLPASLQGVRHLRWRLGDIRDWINPARQLSPNGKNSRRQATTVSVGA